MASCSVLRRCRSPQRGNGSKPDALPADRESRHHREHVQRGPGRHGRVGRLALPAALRLAQRVRRDSRRRQGWAVPDRPGRGRRVAPQAVLLAGNQRPDHPLPAPRRHRRGRGLHAGRADRRGGRPTRPPGSGRPRPAAARAGVPPGVRLRPGAPRHHGERKRRPLRRSGPVPGAGGVGPPPERRQRCGRRVPSRRGRECHLRPPSRLAPTPTPDAAPGPRRPTTGSATRSTTGSGGPPGAPTTAGGARWSSARPWRSSC